MTDREFAEVLNQLFISATDDPNYPILRDICQEVACEYFDKNLDIIITDCGLVVKLNDKEFVVTIQER